MGNNWTGFSSSFQSKAPPPQTIACAKLVSNTGQLPRELPRWQVGTCILICQNRKPDPWPAAMPTLLPCCTPRKLQPTLTPKCVWTAFHRCYGWGTYPATATSRGPLEFHSAAGVEQRMHIWNVLQEVSWARPQNDSKKNFS